MAGSEPSIHRQHRQRLKKRFLTEGLDHFDSVNLLELILFYAIPQGDTNPIAHRLLDTFGSLSGVMNASYERLVQVDGVGEHAATLLKLFPQVCRRYLDDCNATGDIVSDSGLGVRYLSPKFIGRTVETAFLLCLNGRLRVIYCDVIAEGSQANVSLKLRTIVERAINVNARRIVIAHNHPGSFALPSHADVDTTKQLRNALQPLGIELYDHLIFADGECVSLRQSGVFKSEVFDLEE